MEEMNMFALHKTSAHDHGCCTILQVIVMYLRLRCFPSDNICSALISFP